MIKLKDIFTVLSKQSLYEQVYTDTNLHEAWRHVRANSKVAGVDGITVYQFQGNLSGNLKCLQGELINRKYSPRPIKRFWILKSDGTKRPIGILTVRDRIIQRAIYQVIEPIFERSFEESSYAFRKGRSVDMAIAQVNHLVGQGFHWAVHCDIKSFFDYIDISLLYTFVSERVKDAELRRLIRIWLEGEASIAGKKWYLSGSRTKGILQGGVLSPLYANIYLDRFDKEARESGLRHVRFADNILVVVDREKAAQKALNIVRWILQKLYLQLNEKKTLVTHFENTVAFLGKQLTFMKAGKKVWLGIEDNQNDQRV